MKKVLNQIERKTLLLVLIGFSLLIFASSSVYGILPQIKNIKSGIDARDQLKSLVVNEEDLQSQREALMSKVEDMKRMLKGDMANLPEQKIEAYIIGELQNISWNHEINLIEVKPENGTEIEMFQEILFNVKVSGEYFALYEWLHDLRKNLGFIVIKELQINSTNQQSKAKPLVMKLTVATYKSI